VRVGDNDGGVQGQCILLAFTILYPDTTTVVLHSPEVINKNSFSVVTQWSFGLFIIINIIIDVT
jgi:hypothetical protein